MTTTASPPEIFVLLEADYVYFIAAVLPVLFLIVSGVLYARFKSWELADLSVSPSEDTLEMKTQRSRSQTSGTSQKRPPSVDFTASTATNPQSAAKQPSSQKPGVQKTKETTSPGESKQPPPRSKDAKESNKSENKATPPKDPKEAEHEKSKSKKGKSKKLEESKKEGEKA